MGGKYLSNKKKDVEKIEIFFSFLSLFPFCTNIFDLFVFKKKEWEVCILTIKRKMWEKSRYFFFSVFISKTKIAFSI